MTQCQAARLHLDFSALPFHYTITRSHPHMVFGSTKDETKKTCWTHYRARRSYVSGFTTPQEALGRNGATMIHNQYVTQLLRAVPDGCYADGFTVDGHRLLLITDHARTRCLAILPRDWIYMLPESEVKHSVKILREARNRLAAVYSMIHVALFAPNIPHTDAAQRRLKDGGVLIYDPPYTRPDMLIDLVKEMHGVDLSEVYPGHDTWPRPIIRRVKRWISRILLRTTERRVEVAGTTKGNEGRAASTFLMLKHKYFPSVDTKTAPFGDHARNDIEITTTRSVERTLAPPRLPPDLYSDGKPLKARLVSVTKRLKRSGAPRRYTGISYYRVVPSWQGPRYVHFGSSVRRVAQKRSVTMRRAVVLCIRALHDLAVSARSGVLAKREAKLRMYALLASRR